MKAYNPCMPYVITLLAEREGFEPSVPRKVQQISSLPHSTALAPLLLYKLLIQIRFPLL